MRLHLHARRHYWRHSTGPLARLKLAVDSYSSMQPVDVRVQEMEGKRKSSPRCLGMERPTAHRLVIASEMNACHQVILSDSGRIRVLVLLECKGINT